MASLKDTYEAFYRSGAVREQGIFKPNLNHPNSSYVPTRLNRDEEMMKWRGPSPNLDSVHGLSTTDFDSLISPPQPGETTQDYERRLPKRFLKFRNWVVSRQVKKVESKLKDIETEAAIMWHHADTITRAKSSAYQVNRNSYEKSSVTSSAWYKQRQLQIAETLIPLVPKNLSVADKERAEIQRNIKVQERANSITLLLEPRTRHERERVKVMSRINHKRNHTRRESHRLDRTYTYQESLNLSPKGRRNLKKGLKLAHEESHHSHHNEHELIHIATEPVFRARKEKAKLYGLIDKKNLIENAKNAKNENNNTKRGSIEHTAKETHVVAPITTHIPEKHRAKPSMKIIGPDGREITVRPE